MTHLTGLDGLGAVEGDRPGRRGSVHGSDEGLMGPDRPRRGAGQSGTVGDQTGRACSEADAQTDEDDSCPAHLDDLLYGTSGLWRTVALSRERVSVPDRCT
jgi:hypothetical protein